MNKNGSSPGQKVHPESKNEEKTNLSPLNKKTFLFVPKLSLNRQIDNFNEQRESKQWNGQIVFIGFKGTLKPEYWVILEESLRSVTELSKLTFIDTQLDIERLVLLSSLIQLIQPKELSLKFKHNEIDDRGLKAFLNKGLMDYLKRRIKSFVVVSNPGIFKGFFLKNFKLRLARLSEHNPNYDFLFIKNKEYKSIGFIRISKDLSKEDEWKLEQNLVDNLKESYYYNFSFRNCFNKDNCEAFQYFIEQTYREDKLEQLESLDVGDCFLGPEDVIQKICKRISTSKGLLSLVLTEQKMIFFEHIIKSLTGDRYEQLRLNHIDLRQRTYYERTDESFKILANKLICKSIKILYLDLYRSAELRIKEISQAFMNRIDDFRQLMQKKNQFIPKFELKKIDASTLLTENNICQLLSTFSSAYLAHMLGNITTHQMLQTVIQIMKMYVPRESQMWHYISTQQWQVQNIKYKKLIVFFFLAEAFLYQRISLIIPYHIQGLIQEKEVYQAKTLKENESSQKDEQIFHMDSPENKNQDGNFLINENIKSTIVKQVSGLQTLKTNMILKLEDFAYSQNGRVLGYIIDLSLSQVAKLSLFTDVSFIMLTFYCKYRIIALLALISTGFNVSLQLYELLMFIASFSVEIKLNFYRQNIQMTFTKLVCWVVMLHYRQSWTQQALHLRSRQFIE